MLTKEQKNEYQEGIQNGTKNFRETVRILKKPKEFWFLNGKEYSTQVYQKFFDEIKYFPVSMAMQNENIDYTQLYYCGYEYASKILFKTLNEKIEDFKKQENQHIYLGQKGNINTWRGEGTNLPPEEISKAFVNILDYYKFRDSKYPLDEKKEIFRLKTPEQLLECLDFTIPENHRFRTYVDDSRIRIDILKKLFPELNQDEKNKFKEIFSELLVSNDFSSFDQKIISFLKDEKKLSFITVVNAYIYANRSQKNEFGYIFEDYDFDEKNDYFSDDSKQKSWGVYKKEIKEVKDKIISGTGNFESIFKDINYFFYERVPESERTIKRLFYEEKIPKKVLYGSENGRNLFKFISLEKFDSLKEKCVLKAQKEYQSNIDSNYLLNPYSAEELSVFYNYKSEIQKLPLKKEVKDFFSAEPNLSQLNALKEISNFRMSNIQEINYKAEYYGNLKHSLKNNIFEYKKTAIKDEIFSRLRQGRCRSSVAILKEHSEIFDNNMSQDFDINDNLKTEINFKKMLNNAISYCYKRELITKSEYKENSILIDELKGIKKRPDESISNIQKRYASHIEEDEKKSKDYSTRVERLTKRIEKVVHNEMRRQEEKSTCKVKVIPNVTVIELDEKTKESALNNDNKKIEELLMNNNSQMQVQSNQHGISKT